jgi:DNA-binding beta-propeller fold protein YncE
MPRVPWVIVCAVLLLVPSLASHAQEIVNRIDLDDGDPDLVPDSPYGAAISPDGRFLLVCISGDPDFDPNPPQLNNNEVRVIDRATDSVVNTVSTGFFPVECAVTVHGEDAYLYVANSSDGTVSVFRAAGGDFDDPARVSETEGSPVDVGFFSFPNGVVASEDGRSVFVSTSGGTGEILRVDADPSSPTFNTVLETIVTAGVVNRMAVHEGRLVATQSVFDATYTFSTARVTLLDVDDPADRSEIYLTPQLDIGLGELGSAVDVALRPDGTAYVTVLGAGTGSNLFVLDVANRTLARTVNLSIAGSENLHGIGISPDGRLAAITALDAAKIVLLDLRDDSVVAVLDVEDQPNEAVWSLASDRLYVTNQGDASVSVAARFPGRDLVLAGTTTPSLGGVIELEVRGGDEGRRGGVVFSEAGNDGTVFKGFPVPISDPVQILSSGTFDVRGRFLPAPVSVPADPSWIGKTVYYLAGTRDGGGEVRFSNVLTVIHQP